MLQLRCVGGNWMAPLRMKVDGNIIEVDLVNVDFLKIL